MNKNNKKRLLLFTKEGNTGQVLISKALFLKFSGLFQVPDEDIDEQKNS